jgi:hypothetical protein
MTLEQLLVLAFLIGIPLIDALIRALRAGTSGSPSDTGRNSRSEQQSLPRRAAPPVPVAQGSSPPPLPPELPSAALPPLSHVPAAAGDAPEHPGSPEHGSAGVRPPRRHQRLAPRDEQSRRSTLARQRPLPSADLRRAVVLMTILGPCRALDKQDATDPGVR